MIPEFGPGGLLPPGLHGTSLAEVRVRFGGGSERRVGLFLLLTQVVEAAAFYPTIKRVLVWGSFVTAKAEPNDLDYSLVVSVEHDHRHIAPEHRRFLVPFEARQFYGVDKRYLVIQDFPLAEYAELMDFLTNTRRQGPCGVVEINLRGEFTEVQDDRE